MRAPKAKEIGPWLWHGLNAASLAQWLWSLGGGAVVTALLSALLHLPTPWSFVFAAGAFLLAAAAILTLLSRQYGEPKSAGPRQTTGRSWTGLPPASAPPQERESHALDRSRVQGHSRRVLLGAPLALVAVAMVAFLIAQAERDGSSVSGPDRPSTGGRAEAASEEMATNTRYNLSAGLRVANRSYDDRWATHIRADPTDRLALALTLENKAPVTSYPLVLWTNYEQDPEAVGDYRVRLLVAAANGAVLLNSPWVYFHPWTNQVEDFQIETGGRTRARVSDPDGDLLRTVRGETGTSSYVTPVELRSPYQRWADRLPVGPLASGQRVLVEFGAGWSFPSKAEFGTTTPTFGIEGRTDSDTLNTGSVRVGDLVTFTTLLDNQGTVAFTGHLRVAFQPRRRGRYILMRLYGSLWEGEALIGTATINSADGRPIALIPQPGSTEVWSHPPGPWIREPDCPVSSAPIKKRVLEDGITLGGVDIGDFGGFTPHGNCAGVEFNEQLHFKATVVPR